MKAKDFEELILKEWETLANFMEDYKWQDNVKEFMTFNNVVFVEGCDEDISDSYDFTDNLLKRVFKHTATDNYFMVEGREQSYSGTSWTNVKDVQYKQKTVVYYE